MEDRDELLDLVYRYINNRNVSPRSFGNVFSRHNNRRQRERSSPQQPQQPENERMLLILNDLLMRYNDNISRYQENMESLISIFRNFIPTQRYNSRTRTETPPTFYYNWVPQSQQTFENVIVSPSDEEINRATTISQYNPETPLMNTRCPITLDNFQEGDEITLITHCGHAFKSSAFTSWFRGNVRCPICRYDIREYRGSGDNSIPDETQEINNNTDDVSNNTYNGGSQTPISPTINRPIHQSSPQERMGQNDIANMVQRLITDSLTSTLQDMNSQSQSSDENSTFMFDFIFPSIIRDPSNNI